MHSQTPPTLFVSAHLHLNFMISGGFCPHGREEKQGAGGSDDKLRAGGRRPAVQLLIPSLQTKGPFLLKFIWAPTQQLFRAAEEE